MSYTSTPVFTFHPFRLDPAQRVLSRNGEPVSLTPKEFDTLLVLVQACGAVVDKEELITLVWPDSHVGDGSLARNISVLRKTLGDEVIETHRGRGYRVTLPVMVAHRLPAASTAPPAETQTVVQRPAFEAEERNRWLKKAGAIFAIGVAISVLAFVASRFLAHNSVKAHTPAGATPIQSILIQKEGAIDPLDEGFKLYLPDESPSPHAMYNRETNGVDRWRFESKDQNYYYRPLSAEEKDFALQRDWKLICICAVQRGDGFANIDFAGKGPRFDIDLHQEGNRYFVGLETQISPTVEFIEKIEFAGIADIAHPHTYELRYDHVNGTASLWIDGKQRISGYRGHHQFQEDRGLFFGAAIYGNSPKGTAVFRRVRFEAD